MLDPVQPLEYETGLLTWYSVNALNAHEVELYSNVAALPRRVDRDVPVLFRKIDINRSAVDISTCLHLSE